MKTRPKHPDDITLPTGTVEIVVTPDSKTVFVTAGGWGGGSGTLATIGVESRTKHPDDIITVGAAPYGVAVTSDGKTAFVTNNATGTVSTIDVKTRTKHPTDIAVGPNPLGVAVTPCRR